jgi:small subunit ribosomal protein S21
VEGRGAHGSAWVPLYVAGRPSDGTARFRHGLGVCWKLAEVKLQEGETLESALRRFKRKVQQEDIIKEVKRHSFYLKPGEKKRVKQALARKRNRKKSRREIE